MTLLLDFFMAKKAAALPPPLPNPVTGGRNWFHGTMQPFAAREPIRDERGEEQWGAEDPHGGHFDSEKNEDYSGGDEPAPKHWNTDLGTHFTSIHEIAHRFANSGDGARPSSPGTNSRIAHTTLHLANPKHYESEFDLSHEAIKHAHSQGLHYGWDGPLGGQEHDNFVSGDHSDSDEPYEDEDRFHSATKHLSQSDRGHIAEIDNNGPDGYHEPRTQSHKAGGEHLDNYLAHHPERDHIVSSFRDHLESQGHDGITYGNEYENAGGHRHTCAIAFDPGKVNISRWQWTHPDQQHRNHPDEAPLHGTDPLHDHPRLLSPNYTPSEGEHWSGHDGQRLSMLTAIAEHEYRMQHGAPDAESGAPMHDLTARDNAIYPDDIYTHPHYYGIDHHDPSQQHGWSAARRLRGKPETSVSVYRAVPHGVKHINPGDWVTTNKKYAKEHGVDSCPGCGGDMQVIHARIRAKHLHTNGDSLAEWGYTGDIAKEHTGANRIRMSCPKPKTAMTQQRPDPDPIEYRHVPPRDPYAEEGQRPSGHHTIRAYESGRQVGRLSWFDPGEGDYARLNPEIAQRQTKIDKVEVATTHRRQGLAAEMLRRAREITSGVRHSDELTRDGHAWRDGVDPDATGTPFRPTRMQHRLGGANGADEPYANHHWSAFLPGYQREHDWLPDHGIFSRTKAELDPVLFGPKGKMRGCVKKVLFQRLDAAIKPTYDDWRFWSRNYFAGGEASFWWGNHDLDLLIGIDYDTFRKSHPEDAALSDEEISAKFTRLCRADYNDEGWIAPWDGEEWHVTAFSNPASWDIRDIKPYAAYLIDNDTWVVPPPQVDKDWGPGSFPESDWVMAEGYLQAIDAVAKIKDPQQRAREGASLYEYLHGHRREAFGEHGTGWNDPANVIWKFLEYHPSNPVERLVGWAHEHNEAKA